MATAQAIGDEINKIRTNIANLNKEIRDSQPENPLLPMLTAQLVALQQELPLLQQQRLELLRKDNIMLERGGAGQSGASGATSIGAAVVEKIIPVLQRYLQKRTVEVSASKCSSTQWNQKLRPLLAEAYFLDYSAKFWQPCCNKLEKLVAMAPSMPVFQWPDVGLGEDDKTNVAALAGYLHHMSPPGVTVLPVQHFTWYTAHLDLSPTSTLIIKPSRTDYLWVLAEALVGRESITLDDMLLLMPYVVGIYEAKLPSELRGSSLNQGVLEYLGINHIVNPTGSLPYTIPVVVGDGFRHACVHHGGDFMVAGMPKPALHITMAPSFCGQYSDSGEADAESMARIKSLLTKVAASVQKVHAGEQAGGDDGRGVLLHGMDVDQPAAGQSGSGSGAGISLQLAPAGHGGGMAGHQRGADLGGSADIQAGSHIDSESDLDAGSPDEAAQEAYALNVHAQQMMAVLKEPSVYRSLGLTAAPISYSPLTCEDYFRGCTVLDPTTGLPFGQKVV